MRVRSVCLLSIVTMLALAPLSRAEEPAIVLAAVETSSQYMRDGKPAGYIPDILTEAFRRTGHPVKIRLMPWARCLSEARAGAIDGIFGATRTPAREAQYLFSDEPLIIETASAFARTDDPTPISLTVDGLADVRIGLINGSSFGAPLDRAMAAKELHHVDFTSNLDSLVHMLAGHRVDVIAADRLAILGAAKKGGLLKTLHELSPPLLSGPSYVAFTRARDMSAISRDFSAALKSMKADGTYAAIFAKNFN